MTPMLDSVMVPPWLEAVACRLEAISISQSMLQEERRSEVV